MDCVFLSLQIELESVRMSILNKVVQAGLLAVNEFPSSSCVDGINCGQQVSVPFLCRPDQLWSANLLIASIA